MKVKKRMRKCSFISANGKIMHKKTGRKHFLIKKSKRRKLNLKHVTTFPKQNLRTIKKMLGI